MTILPFMVPATVFAMGVQITFIKMGLNNTVTGVILAHLICSLPYAVRLMMDGTEAVGNRLEEQARVLGASRALAVSAPVATDNTATTDEIRILERNILVSAPPLPDISRKARREKTCGRISGHAHLSVTVQISIKTTGRITASAKSSNIIFKTVNFFPAALSFSTLFTSSYRYALYFSSSA